MSAHLLIGLAKQLQNAYSSDLLVSSRHIMAHVGYTESYFQMRLHIYPTQKSNVVLEETPVQGLKNRRPFSDRFTWTPRTALRLSLFGLHALSHSSDLMKASTAGTFSTCPKEL